MLQENHQYILYILDIALLLRAAIWQLLWLLPIALLCALTAEESSSRLRSWSRTLNLSHE